MVFFLLSRCANSTSSYNSESGNYVSGASSSSGVSVSGQKECGSFLNQCSKYLDLTAPLMIGSLPPSVLKMNKR